MTAKFDPQKHHRRSIRLKGYDYSQAGAYFVTVVCQNRAALFGKIADGEMILNESGKMVAIVWESMTMRFPNIELGAYVIMPNHFHAIVMILPVVSITGATTRVAPTGDDDSVGAGLVPAPITLGTIVGAFKSISTHEYIRGVDEKGWPQFDKRLWQRNYYERIIRSDREMGTVWRYIENNPAMWVTDDENPNRRRR